MTLTNRMLSGLLVSAAVLAAQPASAQSQQTYVDLSAGVGYSTNPRLTVGGDRDSVFGRVSALGAHSWQTERSATQLSGFVETSLYGSGEPDSTEIFNLGASTQYQATETVSLFGSLSFSGDFGGQLSTRFLTAPFQPTAPATQVPPSQQGAPPLPAQPTVELPPLTISDPLLFGIQGRQYQASAQAGVAIRPTEREQWNFSANVQRIFFTGALEDQDYWVYGATGGYERQVSERASAGIRVSVQRSDFGGGRNATFITPQATFRTRFSEVWDAQVAAGVTYRDENSAFMNDQSLGLALDASLCRTLENQRLCARVARYSQNAAGSALLETTSAGVDYSRRLGQFDELQLRADIVRSSGFEVLGQDSASTYYTAAGTYRRRFGDRLSGGIFVNARKLSQFGTDPRADVGGSVFLSYRLGDIR